MNAYRHVLSILAGVVIFFVLLLVNPLHLDPTGRNVAAAAALMITWWVTEALPMPIVGLLPMVLFPLMSIATIEEAAKPYSNPIIYLCFGGFLLGTAIEKWNLHKRIALNIVHYTGTSGDRIIMGFMMATGFLSMWLSNTATTMMMFPIAMSVIKVMEQTHAENPKGLQNLSICLLLTIAYASNIGGIGTIIGTPPNVAYVAYLEREYEYAFDFSQWMLLCFPLAILLSIALFIVMVKILYPNRLPACEATKTLIEQERHRLGKLSRPEARVLMIFVLIVVLWITRDLINKGQSFIKLDDTMIAIFGGVLLFLVPSHGPAESSKQLLEWDDTQRISWGLLFLFGGGITMATQLEKAGIIQLMGQQISGLGMSGFLFVLIIALVSVFISEVMSNTAQVIVFTPVIAGIANSLHLNPLQLGMAMTLSASCAGMLPMGSPAQAIVFGSGKLHMKNMTSTGFIMNLVAAVLISLFCWYLLPLIVSPLPGY